MYNRIRSLLLTLLVIDIALAVHESGHLLVALLLGVPVAEVSMGLGPRIGFVSLFGIEWSLRWIPLGAFVEVTDTSVVWKTLLIVAAGPTASLLLGLVAVMDAMLIQAGVLMLAIWFGADHLPWIQALATKFRAKVEAMKGLPKKTDTGIVLGPVATVRAVNEDVRDEGIWSTIGKMSIGIFVLNGLMPFFPLDGGKIWATVITSVLSVFVSTENLDVKVQFGMFLFTGGVLLAAIGFNLGKRLGRFLYPDPN